MLSIAGTRAAATACACSARADMHGAAHGHRGPAPPPARLELRGQSRSLARKQRVVTYAGGDIYNDDDTGSSTLSLENLDPDLIKELTASDDYPALSQDEDWDWDRDWNPPGMQDAVEIPTTADTRNPWHIHADAADRTPYLDFEEGQELTGTVSWMMLDHGIMVDVGADYDALAYVHELDWFEAVQDMIDIDDQVTVRVKHTMPNTGRFVFPLEVDIISPDVTAQLLQPPRKYPSVYWTDADVNASPTKLAKEVGRPLGNSYFDELDEEDTKGKTDAEMMALAGLDMDVDEEDADDDEGVIDVEITTSTSPTPVD